MAALNKRQNERPRELRRRVVISARMRSGAQWSDACILNISSRGMMIHSGRAGPLGAMVELRRGDHVIIAQVVWRDGTRAGLRSDERLPVDQILSVAQTGNLRLIASEGARIEHRKQPRSRKIDARALGRAFEFAGAIAIVLVLAAGIWDLAQRAFASPLGQIDRAFSNNP